MLIIFILIANLQFAVNFTSNVWKKANLRSPSVSTIISIVLIIFLMTSEIGWYKLTLPENYYQTYQLQRQFTTTQLKSAYKQILLKYHPDKNPEVTSDQFQNFAYINTVLASKEKKDLYDKFGPFTPTNSQVEWENLNKQLENRQFMMFSIFYLIELLMVLISTYSPEMRPARRFCLPLIGISGYYEWDQIYQNQYPPYLGLLFPQMAVFEMVTIQKIVLTSLIAGIIFKFCSNQKGIQQVSKTLKYHENLLLKNKQIQLTLSIISNFEITEFKTINVSLQSMVEQLKLDQYTKKSTIALVVNGCVMFTVLIFLFGQSLVNQVLMNLKNQE